MERLKGRSLAQILPDAPDGVGVDAALKVCIEVCDGLEYVHVRHGVVHRDIKPDNIFLHVTPRNGSVTKILDFGVAHIADLEKRYTKENLFLGTPRYAAPEQVMGEVPTPRADLYAVGLLLYELLLGYGPFDDAQTFAAVATAHVQRPPPPFPKTRIFPEGLEALVMSLLAKEPKDRPKSADWLATKLRQIKRIAELAEQRGSQELLKTDLSPMQNILTGHRANMTEAGAPPDVASQPVMSDPTVPGAPMGFLETVAQSAPIASSGGPLVVDRAAATRSLHEPVVGVHRSDTAALAPERPWDRATALSAEFPQTSTGAAVELSSTGPSERTLRWAAALGVAVALVVVGLGAFVFVRVTSARASASAASAEPSAPLATAAAPPPAPARLPVAATALPPSAPSASTQPVASPPPTPEVAPKLASTNAAPARPAPVAASPQPEPAPPPRAKSLAVEKPAPLRLPASGL
jgi:hypothetical protein